MDDAAHHREGEIERVADEKDEKRKEEAKAREIVEGDGERGRGETQGEKANIGEDVSERAHGVGENLEAANELPEPVFRGSERVVAGEGEDGEEAADDDRKAHHGPEITGAHDLEAGEDRAVEGLVAHIAADEDAVEDCDSSDGQGEPPPGAGMGVGTEFRPEGGDDHRKEEGKRSANEESRVPVAVVRDLVEHGKIDTGFADLGLLEPGGRRFARLGRLGEDGEAHLVCGGAELFDRDFRCLRAGLRALRWEERPYGCGDWEEIGRRFVMGDQDHVVKQAILADDCPGDVDLVEGAPVFEG